MSQRATGKKSTGDWRSHGDESMQLEQSADIQASLYGNCISCKLQSPPLSGIKELHGACTVHAADSIVYSNIVRNTTSDQWCIVTSQRRRKTKHMVENERFQLSNCHLGLVILGVLRFTRAPITHAYNSSDLALHVLSTRILFLFIQYININAVPICWTCQS